MVLLDLLASLDAVELAAFDKHLKTAHPNDRIALRAFAHFKQFHPRFEQKAQLDLDHVVRKLQQQGVVGAQFSRKQLSNTCSELYGWLKDFLLLKKLKDKSLESDYLWLSVLRERGMKAAHGRAEAALFRRVWEAPKQDVWAYCWNMAAHFANCFNSDSLKVKDANAAVEALAACRLALEQFCGVCSRKVNSELLNRLSQEPTAAARQVAAPQDEPLAELYGMAEALLSGGGLAAYEALEAALGRYSKELGKTELYVLWTYLKNYNSHRLQMGDKAVWERLDRLDKFALQHGLFHNEKDKMSHIQFLNMITVAANRGNYQRAGSLMADYMAEIEEGMRYEVTILADAIVLFGQKRYAEVLQQLKKFDDHRFREPNFAIRFRLLKLISMYESGLDTDGLWNDAVSFEGFLRRSESPWKNAAKASLAFVRFYKQLILRRPKTKELKAYMKSAKPLFFGAWLLEKFVDYRPVK
jgi:hypothetical protein